MVRNFAIPPEKKMVSQDFFWGIPLGQLVQGTWPANSTITPDCIPSGDGFIKKPTALEKASYKAKMDGMARSIMHDADLQRFAEVSEKRISKNQPSHITANQDATGTSLASSMLSSK